MKKTALALLLLFGVQAFNPAFAITPFIITDIRVEGLERLEAGTVFNYLPLKVGDELNDEEARLSIKELFATGFFKDVALEQDGTVLVVKVVERPSISELTITGNQSLDTDTLNAGLEQAGLVQGRIFSSASLDRVKQEIKNTYLSQGRYSATVESEIEELERNRVAITLNIREGRVATIKKVNIIGAKAVSARTLVKQMSLRDKRGWGLFTRRDQYSKQKLEADIETIRSYYLDRGFHDFKIVSRSVEISPNKQNIFISISIDEGAQYVFGDTVFEVAEGSDVEVAGLEEVVTIEKGKPFSRKVVNASRLAVANRYSDEGYAFVDVRPIYETDREAGVVNTVFAIEPKQRVYVRKIEITGNLYTRDQVIRRELRQFEGAWYSAAAVKRSRDRLRRLGYFDDVTIETPPVPGTADQVDMIVIVKERNTGSISFSVGYSEADGTLLGGAYKQRNLLGTGRELDVELNTSNAARTVKIGYIDPYHTADGVSRGFTLARRRVDSDEVDTAEYKANTGIASVNYKIPIAETNSLNFGVTVEKLELEATSASPPEIRAIIAERPDGYNLLATIGVSKDTRDDFFFPTRGGTRGVSLEVTAPGSEYEYYKLNMEGAYYFPLSERLTLKGSASLGYGGGFGDSNKSVMYDVGNDTFTYKDRLPFSKHYFAGGSNSVRGFDGRSLGPRDADRTTPEPIGGDQRLLVNVELLFPPFGGDPGGDGGNDKRIGFFIDGGMVFGAGRNHNGTEKFEHESIDPSALRYAAGLLFNWFSPIGPFSMSYATPLNEEDGDETNSFQITVGSVFN